MEQNNGNEVDDDASVDSFSGPYEPLELEEETVALLKENDGILNALYVTCNGYNPHLGFDPLSIDWESEGGAIIEHKSLQWIEIQGADETDGEELNARDQRAWIRNAKAFYRAVALNRSIRYLMIEGNIAIGLGMEDVVSILTPCVKESSKLCHFVLGNFDLSARTAQLLASALSSSTAKLSSFGLKHVTGISAAKLSKILGAIGRSPRIEELILDENEISDEVATVLGVALPTLSNLKSLSMKGDYEMRRGRITTAGVEAIAEGLNNSSVETLSFWRNEIGTTGGIILAEALSSESVSVNKLDLTMALSPLHAEYILSKKGWEIFFELLQTSALTDLSIGANSIGDENIAAFMQCLNAGSIESLDMWGVSEITTDGWADFFSGLKENTSLRNLRIYNVRSCNDEVILPALCDKTSIDSICNSNHTLVKVQSARAYLGRTPECLRLLKMNEGTDKAEVARRKILGFYFRNGDENLQELLTMEETLMPRILEWVGRDDMQVGYQLLRSLPSLFAAKPVGGKRKRSLWPW